MHLHDFERTKPGRFNFWNLSLWPTCFVDKNKVTNIVNGRLSTLIFPFQGDRTKMLQPFDGQFLQRKLIGDPLLHRRVHTWFRGNFKFPGWSSKEKFRWCTFSLPWNLGIHHKVDIGQKFGPIFGFRLKSQTTKILHEGTVLSLTQTIWAGVSWNGKVDFDSQSFESFLVKTFFWAKPHIVVRKNFTWFSIFFNPFFHDEFEDFFARNFFMTGNILDESTETINNAKGIVKTIEFIQSNKVNIQNIIHKGRNRKTAQQTSVQRNTWLTSHANFTGVQDIFEESQHLCSGLFHIETFEEEPQGSFRAWVTVHLVSP